MVIAQVQALCLYWGWGSRGWGMSTPFPKHTHTHSHTHTHTGSLRPNFSVGHRVGGEREATGMGIPHTWKVMQRELTTEN